MTTKDRIADEALTLFSVKGYKGTSVKDIADAVGIKDSSIYKHFKSKQQILDTIIEMMRARIDVMSGSLGLPQGNDIEEAVATVYAKMEEDNLVDLSKKVFLFYLNDSYMSRFWRFGILEQYQNTEVYQLYRQLFIIDSITYQTDLFAQMKKEKIFGDADPEVMAMSFYCPFFFLLCKYSGHAERKKEALDILDKQVRDFYERYKK